MAYKLFGFMVLALFITFSSANNEYRRRTKRETRKCFPDLGCFKSGGAFYNAMYRPISLEPEDPKRIGTRFLLYTRHNSQNPETISIDHSLKTSKFNATLKTKFIVHGFVDSIELTHWMKDLKDELLSYGDYNVILVDWSKGNLFPYSQATANTQVVGAQIAQLVKYMQKTVDASPEDVHVIGHSLGAHIAGYAGKRMDRLERISGLDPAGPFFEGMPLEVRLNSADANFVDVIHTDGKILGLGMWSPAGHVDFYPNGGQNQPGCGMTGRISRALTQGLVLGMETLLACDHVKVLEYFIESVNNEPSCHFTGHVCSSWTNFVNKKCPNCSQDGSNCAQMGFHADAFQRYVKRPRETKSTEKVTKLYLRTKSDKPFCIK